jgi:hypothetical protein
LLLLLSVGLARGRNKADCCERKYGSVESLHRVTPLMQPSGCACCLF